MKNYPSSLRMHQNLCSLYHSNFLQNNFSKLLATSWKKELTMDTELSEDFAIIASESPDECDRSQLAIFAWLVKVESNTSFKKSWGMIKLSTS